jgi:tetratricopeptide (TPR) repeat protein
MENELAMLVKNQNDILNQILKSQQRKPITFWRWIWVGLTGLAVLAAGLYPGWEFVKEMQAKRTARESFRALIAAGDFLVQSRENIVAASSKYDEAQKLFPGDKDALLKATHARSRILSQKYENVVRSPHKDETAEIKQLVGDCTLLTKIRPDDADSFRMLGIALQLDRRLSEAVQALRMAISRDPSRYELFNILGNTLRKNGEPEEAIKALNEAIRLAEKQNIRYATAYNTRGLVHLEDEDYTEAKRDFNKAIEIDPNYYEPYLNRGILFQKQAAGQQTQPRRAELIYLAKRDYLTAIALKPDIPEAFFNMANLLLQQARFNSAIEYYNRAVSLDPEASDIHNNLGLALANLGKYAEALREFSTAISLDSRNVKAYESRAKAYRRFGKLDRAADDEETVRVLRGLQPGAGKTRQTQRGKLSTTLQAPAASHDPVT